MSELFDLGISAISKHISNILEAEELKKYGAINNKTQTKLSDFYKLIN